MLCHVRRGRAVWAEPPETIVLAGVRQLLSQTACHGVLGRRGRLNLTTGAPKHSHASTSSSSSLTCNRPEVCELCLSVRTDTSQVLVLQPLAVRAGQRVNTLQHVYKPVTPLTSRMKENYLEHARTVHAGSLPRGTWQHPQGKRVEDTEKGNQQRSKKEQRRRTLERHTRGKQHALRLGRVTAANMPTATSSAGASPSTPDEARGANVKREV